MRRGVERYAPTEGYDVGSFARHKYSELVVRKAGLFPGDWALDVQTGTGILGVQVSRAFTRVKLVCTDHSRENLEHARENAKAERCVQRMAFVQALPDMLPFKDERFFFATVGFRLCAEEEPLDTLDEIHRVTGFYGKVYAPALDFTRVKEKPKDVHDWVFGDETVRAMREMGFGKIQMTDVANIPDGAKLRLVTMKRFDPDEGEEEGGDEGEEEGPA
ncbi:MAG: demethylmenaquinone methyltransferase / 2-methoxy-6-polyprenyl,4-benzoquinol methylase [Thermoplasmata archaeon]|jgi:ubiquinone/menaquinone biosynthesis C-methylase UbiE|nr:demethylmenaquinone methyltransferase / 2-methoxy-6-polyprenyl,4-benzoquinol methylase [Thermoplasmata archaeon]